MGDLVTNEHFVPEPGVSLADYLERGHKTAVHHLIRYEWALEVLAELGPASVLDVACGSGYGSYSIATNFADVAVTGADYDGAAIDYARDAFVAPNLRFEVGDLVRWDETLGNDRFDAIVSFDTLEHIEHREVAMQNLVEHLHPDGTLLLSTPVRSKPILNPGWEHHKIEHSSKTLRDFLRRYFSDVRTPDEGNLPHADVFDRVNKGRDPAIYLMRTNPVVCRHPIVFD